MRSLKFVARATGLEPVTYGLTVNCTIFSKMAEFRRKLGFFICGYMGCVLFLCVSVCFCSKFLKHKICTKRFLFIMLLKKNIKGTKCLKVWIKIKFWKVQQNLC